jgi:hypothetical protein
MKTLKTFNLEQDTIRLVRTKPNQSTFVDRAIRMLHNKEEEFDITKVETVRLKLVLHHRVCGCARTADCPTMNLLRKL